MTALIFERWLVRCDACSLCRTADTIQAAERMVEDHNAPGGCPAGSRGDDPRNYRWRRAS